jgi:predicted RNA-binding protein with PIN domain
MSLSYLIDGYNLIHAMTALGKHVGPGVLEKARLRLLGLLHASFRDRPACVTVVFDAAGAPFGSSGRHDFHGIAIHFALKGRQADDVIEDLIQQHSTPKDLTVVSNDHRLQQAARRRHAQAMSCEDFVDVLAQLRREHSPSPASPEKKENESPEETKRLLEEFGDLDAELGEINYPF